MRSEGNDGVPYFSKPSCPNPFEVVVRYDSMCIPLRLFEYTHHLRSRVRVRRMHYDRTDRLGKLREPSCNLESCPWINQTTLLAGDHFEIVIE